MPGKSLAVVNKKSATEPIPCAMESPRSSEAFRLCLWFLVSLVVTPRAHRLARAHTPAARRLQPWAPMRIPASPQEALADNITRMARPCLLQDLTLSLNPKRLTHLPQKPHTRVHCMNMKIQACHTQAPPLQNLTHAPTLAAVKQATMNMPTTLTTRMATP